MKIEKITPFLVDRFLLVRVYTDQGIVGNAEAGLWAHHKLVYEALGGRMGGELHALQLTTAAPN